MSDTTSSSSSQSAPRAPLLAILSTCSPIHAEAHLLPYTANTFVLDSSLLFYFLERRSRAQLGALASLSLEAVVRTTRHDCSFRAQMLAAAAMLPGVEELRVRVLLGEGVKEMGARAGWVRGVEAWVGRGLRVGRVEGGGFEDGEEAGREWDGFAGELSERLIAA